jgi:hypothetical protein
MEPAADLEISDLSMERLLRCWDFIVKNHLGFSREQSIKCGKGMSMWIFVKPGTLPEMPVMVDGVEEKRSPNCLFSYLEAGTLRWDTMLNAVPTHERKRIESIYDPERNYMVCVAVQEELSEDTIQIIKIFSFDGDTLLYPLISASV